MSCLYSFNFRDKLLETVSNFASELKTFEKTSGRTMHPLRSKFEEKRFFKSLMYLDSAPTPKDGWHPNEKIKLPISLDSMTSLPRILTRLGLSSSLDSSSSSFFVNYSRASFSISNFDNFFTSRQHAKKTKQYAFETPVTAVLTSISTGIIT